MGASDVSAAPAVPLPDGRVAMARRLTKDCRQIDAEIDGGDGKRVGRVRWAECVKEPDCDQAGMF